MTTSTSNQDHTKSQPADVLIPLIRAAATIGFAVVPCSLGFVIIAVSEQLIRSIMVGDDPEMLVSELQNQFPNHAIEVADEDQGLVAEIVDLIDHRRGPDWRLHSGPLKAGCDGRAQRFCDSKVVGDGVL
jgi:hypothetical protein